MLRLPAAALTITLLALPAVPAPRAKEEPPRPDYYPTEVGTRLVYDMDDGKGELILRVADVEEKDGAKVVTIEQRGTTRWLPFERVSISERGLLRVEYFGYTIEPMYLLKFPVKAGDKWDFSYSRQGALTGWKGTDTVIGEEEVTVPAGKFKAIKLEGVATEEDGKPREKPQKSTTWFAKGVGRVKVVNSDGAALALRSFTRGKR